MLRLDVGLTFPDGQIIFCGEIFTTLPDSRGKIEGTFRYAKGYLDHPKAFPLDPKHLPLSPQEYITERPEGVHGVFEDALPDDWGRKLLVNKEKLTRREQTVPRLLEILGANGLGALSFSSKKGQALKDVSAELHELNTIIDAAMRYDAGLPMDDARLTALFSCGSSPGGARPKALLRDKSGLQWIAKFPRFNDKYHVEALEAATLHLARNAGISVPEFRLRNAGNRQVLMVKRFDVSEHGGRNHMISMQTLLDAEGYYYLSYSDIFFIIRAYSFQPEKDTEQFFRQMVFNVAIGNTDDHLKNFCMLHHASGFSISPAYDLLPDINENREHRLSFPQGGGTLPPGRRMLEKIGSIYKVSAPNLVINDVVQSVANWQEVFLRYEARDEDLHRLERGINRRLNRLTSLHG